jgi:hypothetical protein
MILAYFQFVANIVWRLGADDGLLFPLPTTTDWLLVTPLLYPQLLKNNQDYYHPVANGKHFCVISQIILATNGSQSIDTLESGEGPTKIVEELLPRLRLLGGQATIPKFESCVGYGFNEIEGLPSPNTPEIQPYKARFQKYLWNTAITAEHLRSAMSLGPDFIPHTHEVLFLEAVAAHRAGDYRSAILYAAISAEVVFGSTIDKEYERVLNASKDERFRIVERTQPGGGSIRKDPIYERLRSRPDFNLLINELTLYVLRRSLLTEDDLLYQKAKRLYSTRNKIAHSGGLIDEGSNETFALDLGGSMAALETAVALFAWLGRRADFCLPELGFVIPN